MASSLFGQTQQPTMSNNANNMDEIKDLLRSSSNPLATLQTLASNGNTNAQTALTYLQNRSSARDAVMNVLQQRGIPVQAFLQNPMFK